MTRSSLLFLLVVGTSSVCSSAIDFLGYQKYVINKDMRNERPPTDGATEVSASLYVLELNFCLEKQELTMGGYFRQKWTDPRLAVDTSSNDTIWTQPDMFTGKIWVPDTFIVEDKEGFLHNTPPSTGARSFLKVLKNGNVLTSFRLRTKSNCPAEKDANEIECTVAFESYGYRNDEVTYKWDKDLGGKPKVEFGEEATALLENSGDWSLKDFEADSRVIRISTGEYGRVSLKLKLSRNQQ